MQPIKDGFVKPKGDVALSILRAIGFLLVLDFVTLLVSLPLFIMSHAGAIGVFRLAPYWIPARKISYRIIGEYPFPVVEFPLNVGHWVHIFFTISVLVLFIGSGVWLLFHNGLCSLSFLCFLLNK